MTIETHTSHIEQWVQSVQIPYTSGILERASYHDRWMKTGVKLEFLMKDMKDNHELLSSHWTRITVNERLLDLGYIYRAIGLYEILPSHIWNGNRRFHRDTMWNKLEHDQHFNSTYWWDFMGDTSILDEGGYIVVLLSPLGVEWLNRLYGKIRSVVPNCSYITTE